MKRLAIAIAALSTAAFGGQSARAAATDDVEFKTGAEFRARYENWNDPAASSGNSESAASIKSRVKLNVTARKGERLQMMVSLIHAAEFGGVDNGSAASGSANNNADTANAAYSASFQNQVSVARAWGWWKATDNLSLKVGRMGIAVGDGSVFSENDWEQNPTMHEGLLANYDMDFSKISLYLVKSQELNSPSAGAIAGAPGTSLGYPSFDPETNMYLLSFDFKNLPELLKTANLHLVEITRDETSALTANQFGDADGRTLGSSLNEQRVGLSVGGEAADVLYNLDAAYVMGNAKIRNGNGGFTADQTFTINQNMVDAMVGYKMPELLGAKATVGFHRDSGASNIYSSSNTGGDQTLSTYDPLFYDRHGTAGLMDVVRWGNLTYFDVIASMMPMDDLEVGATYYMFSRTATGNNAAYSNFGANYASLAGPTATAAARDDSSLGSEIDVFANKSFENNFKIGGHLGVFLPGSYLNDSSGINGSGPQNQAIEEFMLQGTMTF